MTLLAYDATTPVAALALRTAEGRVYTECFHEGGTHSVNLLPAIDQLLMAASLTVKELSGIVVANGPGSFTGLRIALATAKGIAHPLGIPLYAVSTLRGLSYHGGAETLVLPMLDARRQQVYGALYKGLECLLPEDTYTITQLIELLPSYLAEGQQVLLVGDGAVAHGEKLKNALGDGILFSVNSVPMNDGLGLLWAYDQGLAIQYDYADLPASYLRVSQAERERAQGVNHAALKGLVTDRG